MSFLRIMSLLGLLILCSCQPPLERQPKLNPFAATKQFENESSALPLPVGTRAFEKESEDSPPVDSSLLTLGKQMFDAQCAVCHGYAGHGDGLITQRGYPKAKNFSELHHDDRETYQTISQGHSPMPAFAGKLSVRERWAVVHYVAVLQLREHVAADSLSPQDKAELQKESR
jgi:mono/diheme cytochrome c family protein